MQPSLQLRTNRSTLLTSLEVPRMPNPCMQIQAIQWPPQEPLESFFGPCLSALYKRYVSAITGCFRSHHSTQVRLYLCMLKVALLKNLGHALVLVACTKLVLQSRFARFVISILGAMSGTWVLAIAFTGIPK